MKPVFTHSFKVEPRKAAAIQARLLSRLESGGRLEAARVRLVAGADVSYSRGSDRMYAGVVVLRLPALEPVESRWGSAASCFPYVPGLLAFREAPALLGVFRRLTCEPDAILFDGHGIAHPRGLGLASHMGVLLGVPTVGVAKSVLVGEYAEPSGARGSRSLLVHEGRTVGLALRTREATKPVFVSVGNMIDLDSAERLVLDCCGKYRIPEPVRQAHILSNRARARYGR